MRKLFISFLVFVCAQCYANDVIVTMTQDKIEGKIIEVSDSEIKYKKASNPDGPTFVIKMDKVSTIVYENGEVDVVKQDAKEQKGTVFNKDEKVAEERKDKNGVGKLFYDKISHNGKIRKMYHNEDCSVVMDDYQFGDFLALNCPEASHIRAKGKTLCGISGLLCVILPPVGIPMAVNSVRLTRSALPEYNKSCAE